MPLLARKTRFLPRLALLMALALLATSIALAFYGERGYHSQKQRETTAQARILAASVSAALSFEDHEAAQEYVNALAANPEIIRAELRQRDGRVLASLTSPQPEAQTVPRIAVAVPVTQGETQLGLVHLETRLEPFSARASRYLGTGLLALMAAALLALLGITYARVLRANAELASRAADLVLANRQLEVQIEEREKAQVALRQSQKMEAIGQLTGGVAHDFNNLLQAMTGCLEIIGRRSREPTLEPIIQAGRQAVERGSRLTRQLMAFARRQALRPEPVDIRDRLLGMSELLARALRADILLSLELDPDLWPINADPTQFEVAVLNLVVNARDALPGGGSLEIGGRNTVLTAPPGDGLAGDFVELAIRDSGVGMTPDVMARAFEPFFTTKAVGQGSGLGLSQVYGFAQQSGGQVRIDSTPGQGTIVTLLLPRTTEAPRRTASQPEAVAVQQRSGRVLLVEDDPVVSAVLGAALGDMGFSVVSAPNGDEGFAILHRDPAFHLLLTDVVMPGSMTGLDLARAARALNPSLPIILTTGYSEENLAAGEFPVLAKPCRLETLMATLDQAMLARTPVVGR